MDPLNVPETAIAAFERVHGILVTVHDYHGRLQARLAVNRAARRHPLCHAAKALDGERRCVDFDMVSLHAIAPLHPQGFIQRCHAGLVEVMVPLRYQGEVVGVLNAGPRRCDDATTNFGRAVSTNVRPDLPTWTAQQAQDVLESLRQLVARLERWLLETSGDRTVGVRDRRTIIITFINRRANQPITLGQLAKELGLSVDRAGHVVREAFGISFLELVAHHRLERAAELLRHSDLPLVTVSLTCGFGDLSGFHRRFRARFGMTPAAFRRASIPS